MPSRPACFAPAAGTPRRRNGLVLRAAALAASLLLAGCAAQMAFKDGKRLVAQDRVEDGLAKFEQAVASEPNNPVYRSAYLQTRDRAILAYLGQASRLAAAGNAADAEKQYQRVLRIDPNNERAHAGLQALSEHSREEQLLKEAKSAADNKDFASSRLRLATILAENPDNKRAAALNRDLSQQVVRPPVDAGLAAAFKKPISIEFRDAPLKQVFEVIAMSSGLNFVFDKDVKTDQKTSIFLKNSTTESAIYMLLLTNQLEQQALDGNTILIYPNNAAKQKDYQELVVKSFFLTNADAKTVANTVKTIVKSRDIVVDEKLNMIIVRDTPEAIRLVEKLVALHDTPEPEVMLEVAILEVKRSRLLDLGIQWPDSLTLSTVGPTLEALRTAVSNVSDAKLIVGGNPVTLRAQQLNSDANLLANPRIRARNHEKAKIVIGEKVPIISTTTQLNGGSPITSETITYVDVGLKLEVEPTVYLDNDVAIKIGLEVSNLGASVPTKSGSSAYRIGTRNASTVLRLKDGENQVLAGLINDEDRKSASKVPGLGDIPILGHLFGNTVDNNDKTEILLSITPHIIRNIHRPSLQQSEFASGTDTNFRGAPDSFHRLPLAAPASAAVGAIGANGVTPAAVNVPAVAPVTPTAPVAADTPRLSAPGAAAAPATGHTAFAGWTGPSQFKVGDQFDVQLVMESQQPVAGMSIGIGYDRRALQVVGIAENEFLKQGGAATRFTSEIGQDGTIQIKAARIGESAKQGAIGPAAVADVSFRAIAPSSAAQVKLLTVKAVDVAGQPIGIPAAEPHVVSVQP